MGWLIALGVLTLLAVLPLGVRIRYDSGGLAVAVIAGPFRISLLPQRKKKAKPKKPKEKQSAPAVKKQTSNGEKAPQKGGRLTDFLPLVDVALDFLRDFRRKLRINRLEMRLTMAGGDPCDLAVNYGRAWSALGNLMPQLDRFFVIRKRDLRVECDFTADQTTIYAGLDLTMTLGRLIVLAVRYGFRVLRQYLIIQEKRKGGALQ